MEVKIGVQHASRELVIESDLDVDEVQKQVDAAIKDGSNLTLTDSKGRRTIVPSSKLAYVEIGSSNVGAVGFRS